MNACEISCKEGCLCKLCRINLACDSATNCVSYYNIKYDSKPVSKCDGYCDWLTKISNPLHWEKSNDFLEWKEYTIKVNKKIHKRVIDEFKEAL